MQKGFVTLGNLSLRPGQSLRLTLSATHFPSLEETFFFNPLLQKTRRGLANFFFWPYPSESFGTYEEIIWEIRKQFWQVTFSGYVEPKKLAYLFCVRNKSKCFIGQLGIKERERESVSSR